MTITYGTISTTLLKTDSLVQLFFFGFSIFWLLEFISGAHSSNFIIGYIY
jgi:hypothetical protein